MFSAKFERERFFLSSHSFIVNFSTLQTIYSSNEIVFVLIIGNIRGTIEVISLQGRDSSGDDAGIESNFP